MKNKLAVKRTALGFVCSYILEDSAESIGQVPFCFQPKEEILRDHARSVHMLILSGLFDSSLSGYGGKAYHKDVRRADIHVTYPRHFALYQQSHELFLIKQTVTKIDASEQLCVKGCMVVIFTELLEGRLPKCILVFQSVRESMIGQL